ncbi:MAG: FAD-dependent oxidoreductase [Oscillospiraceae bacterium]|nr:FAD-dependent oxidoreductase [Oscillospiraceae bacterium]
MSNSIWMQGFQMPQFSPLHGNRKTDILIVGGGLAGLLCAWQLHQAGADYLLIEADRICGGTTGKTTAKITSQHGLIYDKISRRYGFEAAKIYYDANEAALGMYARLCTGLDCDFERKDNYIYTINAPEKLEQELRAISEIGAKAEFADELPLPFSTKGAVCFRDQAQFHPLKFAAAISRDLKILEHTPARAFDGNTVLTDYGRITAQRIIVATHFPLINKHGFYFVKQHQNRSYVIALANAPRFNGMYRDEAEGGVSLRSYGSSLILGGSAHRTGTASPGWSALEAAARQWYPSSRLQYRWAAQDCMTLDGIPYIGKYSTHSHELYVATGFNKWGMTSAMAASMILSEQVQGRESPYAFPFSPQRSNLHPQLAANILESVCNLLKPTAPRCPHLGCALKWNPYEHSWDCPCHGSRFDEDGKLLENPANGDLKRKP